MVKGKRSVRHVVFDTNSAAPAPGGIPTFPEVLCHALEWRGQLLQPSLIVGCTDEFNVYVRTRLIYNTSTTAFRGEVVNVTVDWSVWASHPSSGKFCAGGGNQGAINSLESFSCSDGSVPCPITIPSDDVDVPAFSVSGTETSDTIVSRCPFYDYDFQLIVNGG